MAMTPQAKKRLAAVVRYGICIAAIAWVIGNAKWSEFREAIEMANGKLALASILAFGPAPVLISFRLKLLLVVHDIHLSAWQAIKVTFAGNFLFATLPFGTGGGDAAKAYYIARDTPHKHEAVTTILIDRIIGVASLFALAGIVILINHDNEAFRGVGRVIGWAGLAFVVGGTIFFSNRLRRVLFVDKILAWLPFSSHLQRIDRAAFAFRGHPGRLLICFLLTLALQLVSVICIFLAGWALNVVGDSPMTALPTYLGYTPICFLGGAFPVGVMEGAYQQLFAGVANLGTPAAAALLGVMNRIIQLCWALPGGLVVLQAGRPREVDANGGPEGA